VTSEKKKMKKSLLTARSVSNSIATLPDDVRRGNYRRPRRGPLAPRQRPGSSGNRINSRPINVAASASFRIQCKTDADVKFVGRIRSRFRVFERIRFVPRSGGSDDGAASSAADIAKYEPNLPKFVPKVEKY